MHLTTCSCRKDAVSRTSADRSWGTLLRGLLQTTSVSARLSRCNSTVAKLPFPISRLFCPVPHLVLNNCSYCSDGMHSASTGLLAGEVARPIVGSARDCSGTGSVTGELPPVGSLGTVAIPNGGSSSSGVKRKERSGEDKGESMASPFIRATVFSNV
jgi:hypothetical protein